MYYSYGWGRYIHVMNENLEKELVFSDKDTIFTVDVFLIRRKRKQALYLLESYGVVPFKVDTDN